MTIIDDTKNEAPIEEFWAWLSEEPDGTEGIVATGIAGVGWTPLVSSRERIALSMEQHAQRVADMSGKSVHLVRFVRHGKTGRVLVPGKRQ